jgi:hypothetical protein
MPEKHIHECKLVFKLNSEEDAKLLEKAVRQDNPEFVTTAIEGTNFKSTIKADSINSLINTLDDYLACLALAEKLIKTD